MTPNTNVFDTSIIAGENLKNEVIPQPILPVTTLNSMNKFLEPRKPNEIDMVFIVGEHLKKEISVFAANAFLNDPLIISIKDSGVAVQRTIINRWFTNLFLIFRSKNDVNVTDVLSYLINDGYIEDWFTIFNFNIIPFIKKHTILI